MFSSGYNAGQSLLGGLSQRPSVAAYGKGRAMATGAGLGLQQAQGNAQMAVDQQQQEMQQRMQHAGNMTQRAGNETQQHIAAGGMANRKAMIDTNMAYDQAGYQRQRALNFRQALFNSLTQDA